MNTITPISCNYTNKTNNLNNQSKYHLRFRGGEQVLKDTVKLTSDIRHSKFAERMINLFSALGLTKLANEAIIEPFIKDIESIQKNIDKIKENINAHEGILAPFFADQVEYYCDEGATVRFAGCKRGLRWTFKPEYHKANGDIYEFNKILESEQKLLNDFIHITPQEYTYLTKEEIAGKWAEIQSAEENTNTKYYELNNKLKTSENVRYEELVNAERTIREYVKSGFSSDKFAEHIHVAESWLEVYRKDYDEITNKIIKLIEEHNKVTIQHNDDGIDSGLEKIRKDYSSYLSKMEQDPKKAYLASLRQGKPIVANETELQELKEKISKCADVISKCTRLIEKRKEAKRWVERYTKELEKFSKNPYAGSPIYKIDPSIKKLRGYNIFLDPCCCDTYSQQNTYIEPLPDWIKTKDGERPFTHMMYGTQPSYEDETYNGSWFPTEATIFTRMLCNESDIPGNCKCHTRGSMTFFEPDDYYPMT